MIVIVPQGQITCDGVPVIEDLAFNLEKNRQARFKTKLCRKDQSSVPVDLVVYEYTWPKLDKLTISVTFNGKEMIRNVRFSFKLSYAFTKHKWCINGNIGFLPINIESFKILEALSSLKDAILRVCPK